MITSPSAGAQRWVARAGGAPA